MCLSKAYIERGGERKLIMDEVASMELGEGTIVLKTLLGDRREIAAGIKRIDLLSHDIILAALDE